MKLFHYTTIDTLAHIMNNRSLKFSRLDQLDDVTEAEPFADFNPLQYIFSCSFTYDPIENIPLWKMYANMETGIRLEFDSNKMFEPVQTFLKTPFHPFKSFETPVSVNTAIKSENIFTEDYILIYWNSSQEDNLCDCIKLKKIEYLDSIKEKYRTLLKIDDVQDGANSIHREIFFQPTDFGFYKTLYWEFQKEIRCLIYAVPYNKNQKEKSQFVSGKRVLKTKHIFVPISDYILNNLKITLAPKATEASRLIVESLTKGLRNVNIQNSALKGEIR